MSASLHFAELLTGADTALWLCSAPAIPVWDRLAAPGCRTHRALYQRGDTVAQILNISNFEHIEKVGELIAQGEIVIAGFNGVFGIFGDADRLEAAKKF